MNNITVAVTGASGHIGNVVCRKLIERGYRVKAFFRAFDKSLAGLALETVQGDVLNTHDLYRLIEGCEIVINCAAIISIEGDPTGIVFKTNTEGPKNVLEVSRSKGVKKLIHISSVHAVMEVPLSLPFDETRPYKSSKDYAYDYSKATGEQLIRNGSGNGSPEVVVVRPSSVIGPYDFKPSRTGNALNDFYHRRIPLLPQGGYDFVDVRDVADSVVEAIEKGNNGEVYLLSGKYYSIKELAQIVKKVTGKKVPKRVLSYNLLKTLLPLVSLYSKVTGTEALFTIEALDALINGHPRMDHSKAATQLDHRCRPLEETIRDFYEWQWPTNKIQ